MWVFHKTLSTSYDQLYNRSTMIPEKIGRYQIIEELGRGGMATVYRGHDPRFKRDVAVKVLPPQFTHDPTFRARFNREAETIAALEHPAIVPVYDFGDHEGLPFLVMRLMTGGSLADKLEENGAIPIPEAIPIINRIASALDRAHNMGVIHRDLKPDNILFDQYGDAFLSDFGIARLAESNTSLTGTGVVGTPAYMSPEQIQGEKLDGRTDIYALGIILFEMLTGRKPYQAETPAMMLVKHMTEPLPRVLDVDPNLPPACETIISKATAKNREERYQTAGEVSQTLTTRTNTPASFSPPPAETIVPPPENTLHQTPAQPVAAEAKSDPAPDTTDAPTPASTPPPRRRRRWVIAIGILLLFCCGATLAILSNVPPATQDNTLNIDSNNNENNTRSDNEGLNINIDADDSPPEEIDNTPLEFENLAAQHHLGNSTIETLSLSSNGTTLAIAAGLDVWLHDTQSLALLGKLEGHEGPIIALAWSSDSRQLATASWDATIRLWDIDTGETIGIFSGETEFTDIAWSPDDNIIAASQWDENIQLFDVASGQPREQLIGHEEAVTHLAWSTDGRFLASSGFDNTVRLWDVNRSALIQTHPNVENVSCLDWSPNSQYVAVCDQVKSEVVVFNVDKETIQSTISNHEYGVYAIAWNPENNRLATGGGDNEIRQWNPETGEEIARPIELDNSAAALTWLNATQLVIVNHTSTLAIYDTRDNDITDILWDYAGPINDLALLSNDDWIATAHEDSTVRIWDEDSLQELLLGHNYGVQAVAISPDGERLASASGDATLHLWDTDDWEEIAVVDVWEQIESSLSSLAWSPDGTVIALGDIDGGLHIWQADTGDEARSWSIHDGIVYRVAWSPDGQRLATASDDGRVRIWDSQSEALLHDLSAHMGEVIDVAWSPDGQQVVSASLDGTVRIWDANTGNERQQLIGHNDLVLSVAWSPNGEWIASGGGDSQIRIWQADSGRQLQILSGHQNSVSRLAWQNDENLISASHDGTLIIWDIP